MCHSLKHRSITEFAAMSAEDSRALLATACELQGALRAGTARRALRGRNLALLRGAGEAPGASGDFQRAASALGARVAQLRAEPGAFSTPQQLQHTAQMLGRLYDAIECIGMPAELVRRIGAAADVPVFEAISSREHPTCRLADQLPQQLADATDPVDAEDRHCTLMQAVLLAALA